MREVSILAPGLVLLSGANSTSTKGLEASLVARWDDAVYEQYPVRKDGYVINRSGHRIPVDDLRKTCTRFSTFKQNELPVIKQFESVINELLIDYCDIYPMAVPCLWWETEGHVLLYSAGCELGLHADIDINYQPGKVPDFQLGTRHVVACITYFGEHASGGELVFPYLGISLQPKPGDVLFFPTHFVYAHQVLPVTAGNRFAYLTYFGQGTDDAKSKLTIRDKSPDTHGGQVWLSDLPTNYEKHILSAYGDNVGEHRLPLTRETHSAGTFDELSSIN